MSTELLPGTATDRLVDATGVLAEDRGAYTVFDAPACRDTWWGHRLELRVAPWEAGLVRAFSWWAGEHGAKGVGQALLSWETARPVLMEPAAPAGVQASRVTVRRLRDPIRRDPPLGTLLRPLRGAAEWAQLLAAEAAVFGMQGAAATRFLQWTRGDRRARIEAGEGVQLGAFQGPRLVGSAGLLHDERVGRYRSVWVLPDARGNGVGGALVSALARWSRDTAPRRDLVITAEEGGPADRLYAALGFSRVSTSLSWGMPAPLDAPSLARRWAALQAGRLPMEHWRHRDHLWGAVCALEEAGGDVAAATDRLRAVLHGHLAAHGVQSTPTQGYHETLTRGWLHLVEAGRRAHPVESREQAVIRAQLALGDKSVLLRHWERDTLMGAASRAAWVPPDKAPLPTL